MIWKRLYSSYSVREQGTLYQLKNVINCTNLKANPKDSVNASHEFITLVTTSHILSAVMQLMNMSELNDLPNHELVDEETWMLPAQERKHILSQISHKVVDTYVNFKFDFKSPPEPSSDGVYAYGVEMLTLGCCSKTPLKKEMVNKCLGAGSTSYLSLKLQDVPPILSKHSSPCISFTTHFSPRQSHQLMWSRFVNTHGLSGHNIECDLHMEHLNRLCKTSIKSMGANKTEKAIQHASKAISSTSAIVDNFGEITTVKAPSQKHSTTSISKDRDIILHVLNSNGTFKEIQGRKHKSFPKLNNSIITKVNQSDLKAWIENQVLSFI